MTDSQIRTLKASADYGVSLIVFRNTLAKGLGLNLTESLCMAILGLRSEVAPTQLASLVGLTTGAMTTMLDRLEARGFITRRPNPRDRRGILIIATEAYQAAAQKLVAGVQKDHHALLSSYGEDELEIIREFLEKFTENLARNSTDVRELRTGAEGAKS
jgi:DNA-binding MarR family transcriptional regulator